MVGGSIAHFSRMIKEFIGSAGEDVELHLKTGMDFACLQGCPVNCTKWIVLIVALALVGRVASMIEEFRTKHRNVAQPHGSSDAHSR
jgi:hypothetical protein